MEIKFLGFSSGEQGVDTPNSSFILKDKEIVILVDASGSPVTELKRNGFDPLTFDVLLLTHAHIDHIYAFPSLIHNLWIMKREKPLVVIGNENTIEKAKALFFLFSLDKKKMMDIIWVEDSTTKINELNITQFQLFHRPNVPVSGFVIDNREKKLSYFPDSVASFPPPEIVFGSDLLIHEAGGLNKNAEKVNSNGHTTSYQAAKIAKDSKSKKLCLIHLPENQGLREQILSEAKEVFSNTILPSLDKKVVI